MVILNNANKFFILSFRLKGRKEEEDKDFKEKVKRKVEKMKRINERKSELRTLYIVQWETVNDIRKNGVPFLQYQKKKGYARKGYLKLFYFCFQEE